MTELAELFFRHFDECKGGEVGGSGGVLLGLV